MDDLGFKLEQRGADWVILPHSGGGWLASTAECKLWEALEAEKRKVAELEALIASVDEDGRCLECGRPKEHDHACDAIIEGDQSKASTFPSSFRAMERANREFEMQRIKSRFFGQAEHNQSSNFGQHEK